MAVQITLIICATIVAIQIISEIGKCKRETTNRAAELYEKRKQADCEPSACATCPFPVCSEDEKERHTAE